MHRELRIGLLICAIFCVVVFAVVGVVIVRAQATLPQVSGEASEVGEAVLASVVSGWDFDALETRAHPALWEGRDREETRETFVTWASRLGKLRDHRGGVTRAGRSELNGEGGVDAFYVAEAEFENGPALVRIDLFRAAEGEFRVSGFEIDVPGED